MAMDADFSHSRTTPGVLPSRERDDRRLVKRAGPLADVDPLEELRHVYVRVGCSGIRQHVTLKTSPAVRGYSVCQMHGARDGALAGNRSAFKHGDFSPAPLQLAARGLDTLKQRRDPRRGSGTVVALGNRRR
jgi:hypothetical protein